MHNIELALSRINGVVVAPGETFSFWRCVGRPTTRAGFERAAALKNGVLVEDIGGAICLASTLIYNAGLLAGMAVEERWCHSVDSYGEARYFELGRDAAVEYAYRDLRMRNVLDRPLALVAFIAGDAACAEIRTLEAIDRRVAIRVSAPVCASGFISGRTERVVRRDGAERTDDLGVSRYESAEAGLPATAATASTTAT